ncbi:MAG TPA: hypothetical protein VMT38_00155 [Terracidiphilus sp.]|nr:hypothetical protein [Terracidiphilus sp.]
MRNRLILACILLGFGGGAYAQSTAPVDVAVCDVVKKPEAYNGKIVRIKGVVVAGFDEFVIKDAPDPNCGYLVNAIWLDYPAGTKGKAGPAALLTIQPARNFSGKYTPPTRAAVTLDKSKDFKQFDSLLAQKHEKGADMCLGCTRYEVGATLVGRLDSVADATLQRDSSGKIVGFGGFGNMNAYPARLVLESVSDVTPKEIDYSKNDEETKGVAAYADPGNHMDIYGAIGAAKATADKLSAGPPKDEAERAAGSYGKSGDHSTGVNVMDGLGNEESAKDEQLGTKDSTDGVLFNCTFNSDRLQGAELPRAVIHIGEHIAELRNPEKRIEGAPPYILESDAWVVTAVSAVVGGQQFLTLPGGYLLWDIHWSVADRNDNMAKAVKDYLSNEAMLGQ